MSLYNTAHTDNEIAALGNRIGALIVDTISMLATWNDARLTRKTLSKLTDRELDDIGLTRGQIDAVAYR